MSDEKSLEESQNRLDQARAKLNDAQSAYNSARVAHSKATDSHRAWLGQLDPTRNHREDAPTSQTSHTSGNRKTPGKPGLAARLAKQFARPIRHFSQLLQPRK